MSFVRRRRTVIACKVKL
ncbi:hypothetical protein LINPERPRIM_LOCUS28825 [Linum perenne]